MEHRDQALLLEALGHFMRFLYELAVALCAVTIIFVIPRLLRKIVDRLPPPAAVKPLDEAGSARERARQTENALRAMSARPTSELHRGR